MKRSPVAGASLFLSCRRTEASQHDPPAGMGQIAGPSRYGFRRGVLPDMQPVFGKAAGWRNIEKSASLGDNDTSTPFIPAAGAYALSPFLS